ncbi:hypothetical protein [uncultured Bartonella sp.]|uniref:hypothetical protein n=1 Tax=uncultured Bartonella sp. TaxID=104108 RepID=UPI0025CC0823|nr:hypothetical protein [uncultured Bartonella sp.]
MAYLVAFSFFQQGVRPQRVMIDATPLKGHDTAASLQKEMLLAKLAVRKVG